MPLITIPLTKLVDSGASEAVSNLSLSLFKAFRKLRLNLTKRLDFCLVNLPWTVLDQFQFVSKGQLVRSARKDE
ncbi:hypothetical protein L195_g049264 [Trifolium pratense]|uniref:Uncharacterized protein n=1 Tax=Trifolium pratense TaxID=57577 RepID=A0A2K3JNL9_TRIPR|nr:hypothetical protein L195_g049264 [Trifolium pratense]